MLGAQVVGLVPSGDRRFRDGRIRAAVVVERNRRDRQTLIPCGIALGRPPMIADDTQHGVGVLRMIRKGAQFRCHFGRCRIGYAGHQCGDRATERARFVAVV